MWLYCFFNLGIRWLGVVVNATPLPIYPRGITRYPLYRRLGGPQGRSGRVRKISPLPGFHPRTVHDFRERGKKLFCAQKRPDRLWGPHSHLPMGTRDFLSRLKRPERHADYSPPSSAEVKNSGAIHLLSCMPSWRAQGQLYLVIKIQIIDSSGC